MSFIREKQTEYKIRLRRLFDRWSLRSVLVLIFLKLLQLCRALGMSAEKHGWRKVASIFVRREYSKFMLGVFRLNYNDHAVPGESHEQTLIRRLYYFIDEHPDLHWTVDIGLYSFSPRRYRYRDFIIAEVDSHGFLKSMVPFFDPKRPPLLSVSKEQLAYIMNQIMQICNSCRYEPSDKRPRKILKLLRQCFARGSRYSLFYRRNINAMVDRIMSAVYVFCDDLPSEQDLLMRKRFIIPDIHRYRHPGWGMLCISAHFSADHSEVDLWWHFNHVVVDGAPMQEILTELKQKWGNAGPVIYPAFSSGISAPESLFCGDSVYRTRIFVNFQPLMELRKQLNQRCAGSMRGPASLGAMIMWCLSEQQYFRSKKFLMPVDAGHQDGHRELGLLVIRPGIFRCGNPLKGFLRFQREINARMDGIRAGKTESHEFLALCSMLHPALYHLARLIISPTLNEIIGTVGLSILRDAEMFVSPMTDIQTDGFISVGNAAIPTEDGLTAGGVCFSGTREQIADFLSAAEALAYPTRYFTPSEAFRKKIKGSSL